ncbi:MAG: glycine zipper family protein [Burkholderiales bacterium]|nr:glycine zipper family protein [Burkholderiales bacterium]
MRALAAVAALPLLAACVSMPSGPGVMVLPGSGKSFDQFRADDMNCRQYASNQLGGTTPDGAAENSGMKSAVIGTAIGAAVGALVGGHGNPAATGAGVGLATGAVMGAGTANQSQWELQRRYDYAYQQCMYSLGHQIPGVSSGNGYSRRQSAPYARPATPPPPRSAAAPAANIPPPPPGNPPPPPPGVGN